MLHFPLLVKEIVQVIALPVILSSDTYFIHTTLRYFSSFSSGKCQLRFPKVTILLMFFRTTWSLRSFLRSYVAPDALPWLTAFLLYSLWFALEDFSIVSQSSGPQLWWWGQQTATLAAAQFVTSSLLLLRLMVPGGKCPPVICFQSPPCRAALQAQQLSALLFCYEMHGTLSPGNCWIFDNINWLWIMAAS